MYFSWVFQTKPLIYYSHFSDAVCFVPLNLSLHGDSVLKYNCAPLFLHPVPHTVSSLQPTEITNAKSIARWLNTRNLAVYVLGHQKQLICSALSAC